MFHTAAYFDPTAGTAANTKIPVVTDDVITTRNNNLFPAKDYGMLYAFAGCDSIVRSRLVTPTFRVISPPQISPVNAADQPGSNAGIADYRASPLRIPGGQELEAQGNATSALDEIVVVVGLQQRPTPAPAGQIYTIHATSTSTAVAGSWSNMALTFDDTLPPGTYAIVGAVAQSATGIAFRFNIPGQLMRPGALVMTSLGQVPPKMQLKGGLGSWGEFPNDTLPQVELLASGADTALDLLVDIVKIG